MEKLRFCIAEFIGTFALIFVGIGAIKTAPNDVLAVALAHGLTIVAFVSVTMHISGGHLNPAVTFGLLCGRHIRIGDAILYWISQLLGGICAALILLGIYKSGSNHRRNAGARQQSDPWAGHPRRSNSDLLPSLCRAWNRSRSASPSHRRTGDWGHDYIRHPVWWSPDRCSHESGSCLRPGGSRKFLESTLCLLGQTAPRRRRSRDRVSGICFPENE